MGEGNSFSLFTFRGGVPDPAMDGGGLPGPGPGGGGGSQSQIFGGVPSLRFLEGYPVSDFLGGLPSLRFFWGGYLVSVKEKFFDTRFGLIHVQTGKKIFVKGPPPSRSKGKNF